MHCICRLQILQIIDKLVKALLLHVVRLRRHKLQLIRDSVTSNFPGHYFKKNLKNSISYKLSRLVIANLSLYFSLHVAIVD